MRLVLLFCGWLVLCYSSLSANETNLIVTKKTAHSFSNFSSIGKKKKPLTLIKTVFHFRKARINSSESIVPNFFEISNISVHIHLNTVHTWNKFQEFNYQAILSYLYPKHAFW